MFDHPTARQVAQHLRGADPEAGLAAGAAAGVVSAASAVGVGSSDIEVAGVSVVLAARALGLDGVCEVSRCGVDLLSEIPAARWDAERFSAMLGDSPAEVASRVRHVGFLGGAELFEHLSLIHI